MTSLRLFQSISRAAKAAAHVSVSHGLRSAGHESRQYSSICRNAVLHLEFARSLVFDMLLCRSVWYSCNSSSALVSWLPGLYNCLQIYENFFLAHSPFLFLANIALYKCPADGYGCIGRDDVGLWLSGTDTEGMGMRHEMT